MVWCIRLHDLSGCGAIILTSMINSGCGISISMIAVGVVHLQCHHSRCGLFTV